MNTSTILLIALCVLVLCAVAFFTVFRGKGKVQIDTKLGKLKAEGENPPPPTSVAAGVKASGAKAGRDLRAHSSGAGGVDVENATAGRNLDATYTPGSPPPKS